MKSRLESRVKKIEEKINPKPREYMIVKYQGQEHDAEEKKKKILAEDPGAKFFEIYLKWA